MSNFRPIYDLPLPIPSQSRSIIHGKRKRSGINNTELEDDYGSETNIEYVAVVTPEERAQRRLAGHVLSQPPPPAPFPHAPQPFTISDEEVVASDSRSTAISDSAQSSSIRTQHLAVMTALLHKCLEQRDFARASKIMAVLLRTEISGRTIDLRHAGFWGIAAEILLRGPQGKIDRDASRQGFDRAKTFYDKMSLQYPWHRSWPNVINAQEFKLAMFSLWVYIISMESKRMKEQNLDHEIDDSSVSRDQELEVKRWELAEAQTISKEMDSLMGTIPFIDDLELIRLRAMIALWVADLIDDVDVLATEMGNDDAQQEQDLYENWSGDLNIHHNQGVRNPNERAVSSRDLASSLFRKLRLGNDQEMAEESIFDEEHMIH